MDRNILFCHIPKCSGTNIAHNLNECPKIKNRYTVLFHKKLKYDIELYASFYKFAVVRDPVDRLISLYFFLTQFNVTPQIFVKYNITDVISFLDNFKHFYKIEIQPVLEDKRRCPNYLYIDLLYSGFIPQHTFVCDDDFNILVDDIVRFSNVDEFLFNKFGIVNNTRINGHSHSNDDYASFTTPQHKKDIHEIYKNDYELFFNE